MHLIIFIQIILVYESDFKDLNICPTNNSNDVHCSCVTFGRNKGAVIHVRKTCAARNNSIRRCAEEKQMPCNVLIN